MEEQRLTPGIYRHENRKIHWIIGECVHTETGETYVAHCPLFGTYPAIVDLKADFLRCPTDTLRDDIWPPSAALPPGIYEHFKDGHLHYVYGEYVDGKTGELLVVYRDLWNQFALMVRPKKMFSEIVDRPERGYRGQRFWLKHAF